MGLKYKVKSIDSLDDAIKGLYTEKDGEFVLSIDGLPRLDEVEGLKAKVDELLTEAKIAKKNAKDAEKKAADAAREKAEKDGDIDALNASWQKKYDTDIGSVSSERDGYLNMLTKEKVHSKAVELATTLAVPGSAKVLLPHIESRLAMQVKNGEAELVIKGEDGKPSALTLEELGKELSTNEAFAPIIVASNASGSGANGAGKGGGAAGKANFGGTKEERQAAINRMINSN